MLGLYPCKYVGSKQTDLVRCPQCNKGRLCDKSSGTVIRQYYFGDAPPKGTDDVIILKCPKCSGLSYLKIQQKHRK